MATVNILASHEESALESTAELEAFLASVERQAYRIARHYTGGDDDALDIVQDTMIRLARRYAGRSADEWPALFFRILRNRLRDWQRRRVVRQRVMAWWPGSAGAEEALAQAPSPASGRPDRQVQSAAAMRALDAALEQLPDRQREAFLLRTLDGLDVADAASAMGVSAGSVKTHYFRALRRLRELLGDHWDE